MKKHATYEKPESCGQELRGKSPIRGFAAAGYEGEGVRRGYRGEVVTAYGMRDRAVEKPVVVKKAASTKRRCR